MSDITDINLRVVGSDVYPAINVKNYRQPQWTAEVVMERANDGGPVMSIEVAQNIVERVYDDIQMYAFWDAAREKAIELFGEGPDSAITCAGRSDGWLLLGGGYPIDADEEERAEWLSTFAPKYQEMKTWCQETIDMFLTVEGVADYLDYRIDQWQEEQAEIQQQAAQEAETKRRAEAYDGLLAERDRLVSTIQVARAGLHNIVIYAKSRQNNVEPYAQSLIDSIDKQLTGGGNLRE